MNFLGTQEHKAFLEGLWQRFRPYLGAGEETEFRDLEAQPHPRIWEMYLSVALIEMGFTLAKKLKEGPDVKLLSDPPAWVEAVVSTDGDKGDPSIQAASLVPQILSSAPVWGGPPEDKMIERLVTSIKEKRNKLTGYDDRTGKHHRGYIEKGLVKDTDPYVIAVNTHKMSFAQFDHQHTPSHIPLVAKALVRIRRDSFSNSVSPRWSVTAYFLRQMGPHLSQSSAGEGR